MIIKITGLKVTLIKTIKPKKHKFQTDRLKQGMQMGFTTNQELRLLDMWEGDNLTLNYNLNVTLKDLFLALVFRKSLGNQKP